eukprot:338865-Amphidinium_carterae.1
METVQMRGFQKQRGQSNLALRAQGLGQDGSQNGGHSEENPASNQKNKERNDKSETQRSP